MRRRALLFETSSTCRADVSFRQDVMSDSTGHREWTFFCDAMLGGLARWLRAAGYDAEYEYGIDDGGHVCLTYWHAHARRRASASDNLA